MAVFKVVTFLTFICVVKASVIVNVFEDKEADSSSVECNDRDCHEKCREDHFTGGWCVDGQCSCNNALLKAASLNTVEGGCEFRACEQLCRRHGFPGGACVGDKCQCDNFLPKTDANLETVEGGCNLRACEQHCWRLGFLGGICVGGKCLCDHFLSLTDQFSTSFISEGGCNGITCHDACTTLGFKRGSCYGARCSCENNNKMQQHPLGDKVQGCTSATCNQLCRRMGYSGGNCDNDQCKCNRFRTLPAILGSRLKNTDSEATSELRDCDTMECYYMCREMNYIGAFCFAGNCFCF